MRHRQRHSLLKSGRDIFISRKDSYDYKVPSTCTRKFLIRIIAPESRCRNIGPLHVDLLLFCYIFKCNMSPVVQLSLISSHPFHKSSEVAPIPKGLSTEGKHNWLLQFTQLRKPRLQLAAWKYNTPRFIKESQCKSPRTQRICKHGMLDMKRKK